MVASVIAGCRKQCVELHDPEQGDGNWSLGCRVYERTIYRIERLATQAELGWLGLVERKGLRFVFKIGDAPVRFYRETGRKKPGLIIQSSTSLGRSSRHLLSHREERQEVH